VDDLNTRQQRIKTWFFRAAYAASVIFFLWILSGFYLPGKGFSALILMGEHMESRALHDLRVLAPYVEKESYGYDGQFYAQLAIDPNLRNPELATAIDNLPYRARRILLCWTAWCLGGGDPERVLQVFALQNVACWLALAALLLRWFPPNSFENYLRWFGVLFCYGMCFSVRASLLDGPSLLCVAIGVMLLEKGRPWLSAITLAISGLVKETNLLSAALLAECNQKTAKGWLFVVLRGALVAVPCALWVLYLQHVFGVHDADGAGNFSLPLVAYWTKIQVTAADVSLAGWNEANVSSVLMMVALTVQGVFLAFRPRLNDPWWRVGVAYLALMIILGDSMWEGYPGAAARALLPMGLAFNILLPRGRRWWLVLLLGNATVFSSAGMFRLPGLQSYEFTAPKELMISAHDGRHWGVTFKDSWYGPERSRGEYWRWSNGNGEVLIENPHVFPVMADIHGSIKTIDPRTVTIRSQGQQIWSMQTQSLRANFDLSALRFEPGITVLSFETDGVAKQPGPQDNRLLTLSLRNLHITVTGRANAAVSEEPKTP
jgi:hypothetical protein